MLPTSRQGIASYLGLIVETVSRLFTRLEDMDMLEVRRKAVTILILRSDLLTQMYRYVESDALEKSSRPAAN